MKIPISHLRFFGFADPASEKKSRNRKRQARMAIVAVGQDWSNRFFTLYAWAGRETTSDFKKRILDVYERFPFRRFGVEANGMQVLFGSLVFEAARERFGQKIRLEPVYQPTSVSKEFRIRTGLEPLLNQNRLFIPDTLDFSDLREELRGFPTSKTMDLADSLESAIRLAPRIPEKTANLDDLDEYAAYLRNTGCPPGRIRAMVKRYEAELSFHSVYKGD